MHELWSCWLNHHSPAQSGDEHGVANIYKRSTELLWLLDYIYYYFIIRSVDNGKNDIFRSCCYEHPYFQQFQLKERGGTLQHIILNIPPYNFCVCRVIR